MSNSVAPLVTHDASQPVDRPALRQAKAGDVLSVMMEREIASLFQQLDEATLELAAQRAESEQVLKEHLAYENDDEEDDEDEADDEEDRTPDEDLSPKYPPFGGVTPCDGHGDKDETESSGDAGEGESVSGNVRRCPIFRRKVLPKPPRLPDDPTEDDFIRATADLALSPGQKIALAALVCGHTAMSAAHKAKVSPRTLYRWRQEPLFKATLDELTDTAMEAAVVRMRTLLLRSTHVISDTLLGSDRDRWAMRVIACPQVWKMGRQREPAA